MSEVLTIAPAIATAPSNDLKTRPFVFDADAVTVRRSLKLLKALQATYEIEDREERVEAQAKTIAETMTDWTADEIMEMPASRFPKLVDQFTDLLTGKVPNESATNS